MLNEHKYFHWFYYIKNKRHLFNGVALLFVWLFLVTTQPFGIYENNLSFLALLFYLFLISCIWVLINYITEWTFFHLCSWDLKKELKLDALVWGLKIILVTHTIFFLRAAACDWECIDTLEYFEAWFATVLLYSFLYVPFSLYARYQYFKGMLLNGQIQENMLFISGSGKEKIKLVLTELIYIKADDNYAVLNLIKADGNRKTTLVRASLKSIQVQLAPHSAFLRIHRSYIINANFYEAFKKGNMELLLVVNGETISLPVSRKYKKEVMAHFSHPK